MTAYELELVAMAKNRGDSLSRQLADTVKKQDEQITELEALKKKLENLPMSLKDDIEYWSEK
jgi:hypothetical protein